MFYVTGQTFLASFSRYLPESSAASVQQGRDEARQEHERPQQPLDDLLSEQNKMERAMALFPGMMMGAALLAAATFFYTVLLSPMVLMTTNMVNAMGGDGNNGNNTYPVPPGVPLAIPCPPLPPRPTPKRVSDLRADDIRAVIGIGDSVMAGFGADGIQNQRFISKSTLHEARGVSFAMGGDQGVVTLPNLIHYYSHQLIGPSVGDQVFTVCFGEFCPLGQYKPEIDQLNGAQSGARSMDINHELDYLLDQLDAAYKAKKLARTDWKLLTFFMGSNDLCHACAVNTSMPDPFGIDVQQAMERIRMNIPNVLVQVIGLLRIDEIFVDTQAYPTYCRPFKQKDFVLHDHECMCAHSVANRTLMANLMPQFNAKLQSVVNFYQGPMYSNDTFAVVFHPLPVNILSFPIQAISNVDCFHPSALAHAWFSKVLWKLMYKPAAQTPQTLNFQVQEPIYCPTEDDRFQVA